jgi:alpha-tubulin suppressor-like RCC1 family protein
VEVLGLGGGVAAVSAGSAYTCAIATRGTLKCWGYNADAQLGDGTLVSRSTVSDVVGLESGVGAVATGEHHTCALTTWGAVKCWGRDYYGELGYGVGWVASLVPLDVVGLGSGVKKVAADWSHTCAVMTEGGLKCWGNNFPSGKLGDGTLNNRPAPVDVVALGTLVDAVAPAYDFTCALTTAGGVKCWGDGGYGQLGNGGGSSLIPVDVVGLSEGVLALTARGRTACALTSAGGMKCWGYNGTGQLGDGTTTDRHTPVDVLGLRSGVMAIAVGGGHTCALMITGGMKCWGYNGTGQLGDGTLVDRYTPVDVVGLAGPVTAITLSGNHSCVVLASGRIQCWGLNHYGQLAFSVGWRPVAVLGFEGYRVLAPLLQR